MSIGTDISFFFNPKTIAVVGASPTPGKPSHIIFESLKRIGFRGAIYLVNPKYPSIDGRKCYRTLAEIKDDIDVAILALPASKVVGALKPVENVKGAIIVSAGFKEVGDAGRRLEEELKEIVARKGIRIIGPNCMGIYDTVSRMDTFFVSVERVKRLKRGRISILTQSGSFAEMIVDEMASEGIGVARIVSYGNRVDVGETDCLEFLVDDEATKVVVLYMESVDNGRRFVEVASRCTKKKPVVAVKVGKMEAGVHAARSHTGAISGRYEIYRAAFKKAGIIEVDGYEGLKDACKVLNTYDLVAGKRVLIITDGGGVGVSMADACEDLGLEVTGLTEATRKRLSTKLPGFTATGNPIDLTGSVTDEDYVIALEEGLRDEYDIVIVTVLWGPPEITERLVDKLKEVREIYNKPILICSPGGKFARRMAKHFEEKKGLPVFYTPESAARAAAVLAGGRM
ncbi:MAG: Acetate--CoA ligase [ADP-forming] I [Candidatus Methanophagaceae archaeon]|nr:MAG: Acetate--CoA ligase [ADP-forming] I [Methanophagales archaeon]KAF5436371.1 Acyl-CoA synthetase (NDP forming) [Methanophagales archaeon]